MHGATIKTVDYKSTDVLSKEEIITTMIRITFFLPWSHTTHSGCVFYSPLSDFSLLAYEVT